MTQQDRGPFIPTASGGKFFLQDPRPEDVHIDDIGHALSNLCRFTGHCRKFYSVAQHSICVAVLLRHQGHPPEVQLAGLLHDGSEAYLGDVAAPLKRLLPDYRAIEWRVQAAVNKAFGLPTDQRTQAAVKQADLMMLDTEARGLMSNPHGWAAMPKGPDWTHIAHAPRNAYAHFMAEFRLIMAQMHGTPDVSKPVTEVDF